MAGHTDIAELHDLARGMLLEYREDLTARWQAGDKSSNLKKVREQLNNLDLDPWSYADILDNAMSEGADAEKIMKELRNHQSRTMKLWEVLSDDTIHHVIGKRTGGDSLAHIDGKVLRAAVEQLVDEFGFRFANHHTNYTSQSDYAHKGQTGTGLELASGVKNTDMRQFMSHPGGNTSAHARNLTRREMQDVPSVVEALRGIMEPQIAAARSGDMLDKNRRDAVNDLIGLKGYGADSVDKLQAFKDQLKVVLPDIQQPLTDTYKLLKNPALKIGRPLARGGGFLLDGMSAIAGTTGAADKKKNILQRIASGTDAASGALGIGSLINPALGPLSIGAGLFAVGDRTGSDIANAVAPYVPTPTINAGKDSTGDVGRDTGKAVIKPLQILQNKAQAMKDSVAHKNNPNDYGITEALRINGPNQLKIFADIQGALGLGIR